ncbi:MAG: hypothetical protein PHU93_03670 [Candidatus Gracilibacteria bacterium]|nr:hypothetical protein [Candidatus Gracilibacteria bacterium]
MNFDLEELFNSHKKKHTHGNHDILYRSKKRDLEYGNIPYQAILGKLVEFKKWIIPLVIGLLVIIGILIYVAFVLFWPLLTKSIETANSGIEIVNQQGINGLINSSSGVIDRLMNGVGEVGQPSQE